MTAEWLYPPSVGPLCGAELEAWYEDLQDILGSDASGTKLTRAPPCSEKEPEFLDVLESCSLTWLTEGQVWGDDVQRVIGEQPIHMSVASVTPLRQEEQRGVNTERTSGGDLLPPEFFELLSEGGVGLIKSGAVMVASSYNLTHYQPSSPGASEEELPTVPDASSCSSASQSPSFNCTPPSSPPPPSFSPTSVSSRLGKRKRGESEQGGSLCSQSPGKKSRREREQENARKVQELTDQNERLKAEIERLGEEVQRTRRALIERLVNTRR